MDVDHLRQLEAKQQDHWQCEVVVERKGERGEKKEEKFEERRLAALKKENAALTWRSGSNTSSSSELV